MAKILTDQLHLDSVKSTYGDSEDLQVYHNSADSYIESYTGNLTFRQRQDDGDISFESDDGSGGTTQYFRVDGGSTMNVFSKPTWYGDGVKALFGNSSDLQIHHDGTHSFISDQGSGNLTVLASAFVVNNASDTENMIIASADGSVNLYYNGSQKFRTVSAGVEVTGNATLTGNVIAPNVFTQNLYITSSGTSSTNRIDNDGTQLYLTYGGASSRALEILNSNGNATFAGDLTIPTYINHTGDSNTYFGFSAADTFGVFCGGNMKFKQTASATNLYTSEIITSGSPQYFTFGGSGGHQLVFRGNGPSGYRNSIIATDGGGVQLYYNNSEKLVTQSGGVSLGNNSLYLGQYSAINLNGVGPGAGKVITGTGTSTQLTWNDSVSNITVGTGLDISSSTSNGAITKNLTLDFNELPVIDGDDPQADWFIVESSEDENSKINRSDLQSVDAHWKTTQTILTSNFDDRSSSTSIYYMPLNYISEVTSANYYNTFACPRGGTVKRIMMMHTAGSTMSTSFTTELSIFKNALLTSSSGELTPSNGSLDGSNITWSPNYTFTAGDRLNFRYQKSATSKYWYGVSVSIIIEFDTI